jgi:hypothetical protein
MYTFPVPTKVQDHLEELRAVLAADIYPKEIDQKAYADLALELLANNPDALKKATAFISAQRDELSRLAEKYNALRDRATRFLIHANQAK